MCFVHQSAKDFLLEIAPSDSYLTEMRLRHYCSFSRSLGAMAGALRTDLYHLRSLECLINEMTDPKPVPPAADRYSCICWAKHLCDCDLEADPSTGHGCLVQAMSSMRKHFLHWLEALSLMSSIPDGAIALSSLESVLAVSSSSRLASSSKEHVPKEGHQADSDEELYAFVRDAKRFSHHNQSPIEKRRASSVQNTGAR